MIITSMPRAAILLACLTALLAAPAVAGAGASCPGVVHRPLVRERGPVAKAVKAGEPLRRALPREPGPQPDDRLDEDQVGAIEGFKVRSDPFKVWRWLPTTKAKGRPGLDIGRAGGLSVTRNGKTTSVPVAGAVRWSKPTGKKGRGASARLSGPGPGDHRRELRGQGRRPRLPRHRAAVCGVRDHRGLRDPRSRERERGLRQTVPERAAPGAARREQGGCRGGGVHVRRAAQAGARVRRSPHGHDLQGAGALRGGRGGKRLRSLAAPGASARVVVRAKVERARTRT